MRCLLCPDLTIEHIMPQTLTQSWQEYLGEEWQLVHNLYLHTLRNHTLTGYNPELSNDDFDIK
ncbi:HNH endonuclease family protein [Anoxybacteroides tepidamans]|uniref:HNH endonuclease family protein n=1 Tax=Anoxybacteroides tepidamans TaxID=265948 RepID=UPI0028A9DF97|nr:HNH endonuclease family protein [Anoxybacillus tepidamans]